MAIAIYARVSTEEQRERQSIRTQIEFGERYCQLHDLCAYRVYADDGVSGTVPLEHRPEGSQILKDARLGKFDQLLVYRLDRLGRETRLILNAVAELEKLGVRVRSMTEEFDTGTSTGRLMLTLLSGFASHERDVIRERSVAGTNRVAESGAWMGGIVPYGYRKLGTGRDAHLVISEDPIPGQALSEADVIREVFRMTAVERKSCRIIAEWLGSHNIPCAYVRDDRLALRGKRKERTSGIWGPGRIRGLITNKTYMGISEFGKRAVKARPVIVRPAPAIVTEATWTKAQKSLQANFLFGKRSAKNQYLLRALIKCGTCGRSYIGVSATRPNGKREFYYRCNGAHTPAIYRATGRCLAKSVRGVDLEQQVWSDVEGFLRNPEPVLQQLHARLHSEVQDSGQTRKQVSRLEGLLTQKATERTRVVGLFRRGRLTDDELDAQMEEIRKEETALEAQLAELRNKIAGADSIGMTISSAQGLLEMLVKRLDEPVTWAIKRRLIEVMVAGVRVETFEDGGVKQTKTTVSYRFSQPNEPMPLVLPQSYSAGRVIRMVNKPETIGDHIRKRRMSLKLLQREVAEQFGVDKASIWNWEKNCSQPDFRHMPAIIGFLGYNPLPPATTPAVALVRHRTILGLSQEQAALKIGVDPSTLAKWERGEREPAGAALGRLRVFLDQEETQNSQSRRVR